MNQLIITDLTRFREGNNDVCIAGVDIQTGECIRPLFLRGDGSNKTRYINQTECKKYNILAGSIISGDFSTTPPISMPHREDRIWSAPKLEGPCTSDQFLNVLKLTNQQSVIQGFGVPLASPKHIDVSQAKSIKSSIITVKVPVAHLEIVRNTFEDRKIQIHFTDYAGQDFRYLAITDFGFFNYIIEKSRDINASVAEVNHFIQQQSDVYLRVGLSRAFQQGDRMGFWLQVNGIYTFPHYLQEIRSYK
ncbi:hypothetical protein [Methylophilus sp. 5]|uniref:dual OB domain-containing protein n=1 Tax=Methylophilus sp. 5 TaxID=1112274 RepID=UPI00048E7A9D|nr:hypothetical protein [Methylophilus sp. 5]